MACCLVQPLTVMISRLYRTNMGRSRTMEGSGSSLWYYSKNHPRKKYRYPTVLSLGTLAPTATDISPTEHMYLSTVCLKMGCPWVMRTPDLTQSANIFSNGTDDLKYWIPGRICIHLQIIYHCHYTVLSLKQLDEDKKVATTWNE